MHALRTNLNPQPEIAETGAQEVLNVPQDRALAPGALQLQAALSLAFDELSPDGRRPSLMPRSTVLFILGSCGSFWLLVSWLFFR